MKTYIIERSIAGVGDLGPRDLKAAAIKSNAALAQLAPRVQWVESFVAQDQTYCIYRAEDESAIREHAAISGFPASRVTLIARAFDPTTATALTEG